MSDQQQEQQQPSPARVEGGGDDTEFYDSVQAGGEQEIIFETASLQNGNGSGATPADEDHNKIEEEDDEEADYYGWHSNAVALYIALFGTFGEIFRVYIGRFFGSDCSKGSDGAPDDIFSNLFVKICVTNSGTTDQTGGALFLDLPANMIGCWIMGLITHPTAKHALPWLHPKHPLQKHRAFVTALTTGVCGCLTTFASWNTQMVQMLDGTDTVLGPQVVAALSGYILGLAGATSFYYLGRCSHEWLSTLFHKQPQSDGDDAEEHKELVTDPETALPKSQQQQQQSTTNDKITESTHLYGEWNKDPVWWTYASMLFNVYVGPFFFLLGFFAAFLVGAIYYDIQFYQEITVGTAMAPFGALARWKLGQWFNGSQGPLGKRYAWVPWGTLLANLVAAVISASIAGIEIAYLSDFDDAWTSELLPAVKVGFAGSLSTVSTMVKEMFAMKNSWHGFVYGTGSLAAAMLLGLLVFSPIARYGG